MPTATTVIAEEGWFNNRWRPAMAWQYFVVCLFDFMIAPIMTGFYAAYTHTPYTSWEPLTLHGGGLYHLSMAAIVGVTVWSRGQEKLSVLNSANGGDDEDHHDHDGDNGPPK